MSYPTDFVNTPQPFPVNELGPQGKTAYHQLADKGYEVVVGLTPELADAIEQIAQEPSLKEYVPKDLTERFTDRQAVEKWLSKGRATFLLVRRDQGDGLVLVGYGWIGARTSDHVPGAESTFAIRVGEAGQGQGLATPFARLIISGAAILYDTQKLWLDTWESNAGAVHVYHKIGAVDVDNEVAERPTANGQDVPDNRIYMSLPDELLNP